jgi:5-methylcytosine-specific restriction endonuclease McrA
MGRTSESRKRKLPVELRLTFGLLRLSWRLLVFLFGLAGALVWLILWPLRRRPEAEPEPLPADAFYRSYRWRSLRIDALEANRERFGELTCECCLATTTGQWHVDHIYPRSLYPDGALDPGNLQVLCEDCNLGKRDRYATDWRYQSES